MTSRQQLRAALLVGARLAAAAIALVVAAIPLALVLLRVLHHGRLQGLDGQVARKLAGWTSGSSRAFRLVEMLTNFGHWIVLGTVVAGVTVALVVLHRRRDAAFVATTAFLGVFVAVALKAVVLEARAALVPDVAGGLNKSFPSGHAMNSAFIYGSLLLVVLPELRPTARWLAVAGTTVLVVAISATRVALHLHYISDVIGGAVFGVAWLGASWWAFSRWRRAVDVPVG